MIQKQLTIDFVVKKRKTVSSQLTGKLYTSIQRNPKTGELKRKRKVYGEEHPFRTQSSAFFYDSCCLLDVWALKHKQYLSSYSGTDGSKANEVILGFSSQCNCGDRTILDAALEI